MNQPLIFLSPRVCYPQDTGAKIRTNALLRALTAAFDVHYIGFLQPELSLGEAEEYFKEIRCCSWELVAEPCTSSTGKAMLAMSKLLSSKPAMIAKYDVAKLRQIVESKLQEFPNAIAHADHLHMAHYLPSKGKAALRVLDEHNVESQIYERIVQQHRPGLLKFYMKMQTTKMVYYETEMVRNADLTLAVSEGDAQRLGMMASHGVDSKPSPIEVIPNGVDLEFFHADPSQRKPLPRHMVFVGSMNWLPNEDAICYFVQSMMPLLCGHKNSDMMPAWTLDVVGQAPSAALLELSSPVVRITGRVDDVRPYIHAASVYVVPLRIGGGSRLKILEAFAMGIPVVSTSVGCEGLDVVHDKQLLIEDDPKAFAEAIIRVESDPKLAQRLACAAQQHAFNYFGWPSIGKKLIEIYRTMLNSASESLEMSGEIGRK